MTDRATSKPCATPTFCTFERFVAYVTTVGTAFLVLAGLVSDEGALFREALLTHVAGERTLASVRPTVFIQTGCFWKRRIQAVKEHWWHGL